MYVDVKDLSDGGLTSVFWLTFSFKNPEEQQADDKDSDPAAFLQAQ